MRKQTLIKDGVKYVLKRLEPEPTKFEPMIKEHVKDIFGPGCKYFAKRKMKSLAGNRSIPDGFVIDFENEKWYVVELKLLGEDAIRRIAGQIIDYKTAVENPKTQKTIHTGIREEIKNFDYKEKTEIGHYCKDISALVESLIYDKTPKIVVVIDNIAGEDGTKIKEKVYGAERSAEIIEFKTFVREGTENVYAHLFEPLYIQERTTEIQKPLARVSRKEHPALREFTEIPGPTRKVMELCKKLDAEQIKKNITIKKIQQIVALQFNISWTAIKGKSRTKSIAFARQVTMYLLRKYTSLSLKEIGAISGGRDHTTIIHAHSKIKNLIENSNKPKQKG